MKVTVFGIGYVGLVQAAVLAQVGHDVCCIDVDENKINQLQTGQIPIYEPGLDALVNENIEQGRLQFSTCAKSGVDHGEILFIAVGTPPDENGSADLQYVLCVAETIAKHMHGYKVIINKSTVPVGTADKVQQKVRDVLNQRGVPLMFDVVSNPEFLKEGMAVSDCKKPDRIIIGTDNQEVKELMRELYAPFNRSRDKMIFMDVRSAELTKYAANCMLATKISFMNEMANLAEAFGADIEMIRQGIGSDPRIGYHFIYPGCGYGGSCFPKDVQALVNSATASDYEPLLLSAVQQVNQRQKSKLVEKILDRFNGNIKGKQFAVWGLAFKPNTDDMREAPSRVLIDALLERGARIKVFDPKAMDECQRIYGHQEKLLLMGTKEACLTGSDALVICTEWTQFRAPDFDVIGKSLKSKLIIDGRNLYDPKAMQRKGFAYFGIGRGQSIKRHESQPQPAIRYAS